MLRIFLFSHHRSVCTRGEKRFSLHPRVMAECQNCFIDGTRQMSTSENWISRATRKRGYNHYAKRCSARRTERMSNDFCTVPLSRCCLLIDSCFDVSCRGEVQRTKENRCEKWHRCRCWQVRRRVFRSETLDEKWPNEGKLFKTWSRKEEEGEW